jgi:hypothetical protein
MKEKVDDVRVLLGEINEYTESENKPEAVRKLINAMLVDLDEVELILEE